jgi:hypothetical protein
MAAVGRLGVTILATAAVCGLSGCSSGSDGAAGARSTSPPTTTQAQPQRIAGVGAVAVRHGTGGLVIVDRATGGRRLHLSGIQAGECLSYLRANPSASESSVRTACPEKRGAQTTGATATTDR